MNRHSVQRQRIGPAVRRLRRSRGLTLDQLAEAAEVSPSHLSRLERSQTLPSFPVMAKIAEALEVDVNEFVRLEYDVAHLDNELTWYLTILALNDEVKHELLGLTIEARRALVACLDRLATVNLTPNSVQQQAERLFFSRGGDASLSVLVSLIERSGMDGLGLTRALLLLNLMTERRSALIVGPSLLPIFPGSDLIEAYRWAFPSDPLDPMIGRWWQHPDPSVVDRTTLGRPSRAIITAQALASPLGAAMARSFLSALDRNEAIELAVAQRPFGPVNILTAGHYGLLEQLVSRRTGRGGDHVALWLTASRLVAALEAMVDRGWESLTDEERNPSVVRERLEQYVAPHG